VTVEEEGPEVSGREYGLPDRDVDVASPPAALRNGGKTTLETMR
jgi:hypothetical protein